jgi:hypothetical protein
VILESSDLAMHVGCRRSVLMLKCVCLCLQLEFSHRCYRYRHRSTCRYFRCGSFCSFHCYNLLSILLLLFLLQQFQELSLRPACSQCCCSCWSCRYYSHARSRASPAPALTTFAPTAPAPASALTAVALAAPSCHYSIELRGGGRANTENGGKSPRNPDSDTPGQSLPLPPDLATSSRSCRRLQILPSPLHLSPHDPQPYGLPARHISHKNYMNSCEGLTDHDSQDREKSPDLKQGQHATSKLPELGEHERPENLLCRMPATDRLMNRI